MGPASIEDHYDEAFSVIGVLDEVRKGEAEGCDGYIIACFGDPGLLAAREVARGPVIGIAEAAMHMASLVSTGFSVVSTLERSRPILEHLVEAYGMRRACRSVRATDIAVLDLEKPESNARGAILAECRKASGGRSCRLSSARLRGHGLTCRRSIAEELGIPVVDGVAAAVKLVEIPGRARAAHEQGRSTRLSTAEILCRQLRGLRAERSGHPPSRGMTSGRPAPDIVQIRLERLTAEAFAPFGQLICARGDDAPIFEAPHLRSWRQEFGGAGIDRAHVHPLRAPADGVLGDRAPLPSYPDFHSARRRSSVMAVAAPTDPDDWTSLPEPGQLRAFYVPGTVGLMLWRGTWHALTRFPVGSDGAGFAFLTDRDTNASSSVSAQTARRRG